VQAARQLCPRRASTTLQQSAQRQMSLCRALAAANDGQEELQGSRSEAAIRGEVQLPSQVKATPGAGARDGAIRRPAALTASIKFGGGARRFTPSLRPICALPELCLQGQAAVAGVGDPDYINRQLMEILAPKTDYLAVSCSTAPCLVICVDVSHLCLLWHPAGVLGHTEPAAPQPGLLWHPQHGLHAPAAN
jgi:hypothetical protein